ncbi:MAG: carboxypeptidase-like regulatory domain-containing protein, partial [Bryobacterales bacterium]|nr:carboxypeptidase-like regulatory domain-containing protein [Bryobacteraceae bacterium]MDW8131223.1 carboxypeptidase-like regulatory domain-containing protein [Bryobacterales bacterium]
MERYRLREVPMLANPFPFRAALALGLALAAPLAAQRTTANIYGVVEDPTGALVPRARVTATNEATGYQQTAESDERGEFTLSFLPTGRYQLRVEATGFKSFVESGITLEAGQQIRYVVRLELGAPTETVTVRAEAPLVENASTA